MSEAPPRPPPPPSSSEAFSQHVSPPPQGAVAYHTPPPPPPKPQSPRASGADYRGADYSGPPAPPHPMHSQSYGSYSQYPPQYPPQQQQQQQQQLQQQQQQQPGGPPPPSAEEGWLPEGLKDKSKADLETLLRDPHLLDALLRNPGTSHPSLSASTSTLRTLLSRNISLAQQLDSQAASVSRQREDLTSRLLQQRAAERQWRLKQAAMDDALAPFSPKALHSRLVSGISEQEQLLRAMEESFLEEDGRAGEREVTEFIRRWREGRKVLALRAERRRRFEEGRVGGWR